MKNVDKMSKRELRTELRATRALLAQAYCPHNPAVLVDAIGGDHGEKCQWCAERSALIGQYGPSFASFS